MMKLHAVSSFARSSFQFLHSAWILLALFTFSLLQRVSAEVIELSPDSPVLSETGLPFLHIVLPEHHISDSALSLVPKDGLYEWTKIGPTDEPFRLHASIGKNNFERATLTVWDWHNHAIFQRQFQPGDDEWLEFRVRGLGSYLITIDGWRDGQVAERFIRNICVTRDQNAARKTWKTDEFFIGVCAFPGRYHWLPNDQATLPAGLSEEDARNREADLIGRTGIQVVRTDDSFQMGRRKHPNGEDAYFFDFTRMDAAVGAFTSRGFQVVLQIMNAPDWAVIPKYADKGRESWRYPHQEQPQRAYTAALAQRYAKHARFVQILNEPDQIGYWTGTNEEYVEQYLFSLDAVKKVLPDMPVTCGGYSLVDEGKCAYFIGQLFPHVDLPVYNAHGNLADYKRSFATMRRFQSEVGDKATGWINTESGYSAWRLEQERRQAQIDLQKVLYSWANEHRGIVLFCSRMTRPPGRDGSPDFGFLDHQYCPRFVYAALSALVGVLDGASYRETLAEGDSVHLYLFQRGEDLVLAGFAIGDRPTEIHLDSDAREVIAVDEMGNERVSGEKGTQTLRLDGYPRYLVFRGATRVKRK